MPFAAPLSAPTATRILGVGHYQPSNVVTNNDLIARGVDTDDEWVKSRVGIAERRYADPDETVVDMAENAASKALAAAGVATGDIDLVITATCTMPTPVPAAAPQLASRLGIAAPGAYDVNSGCSGFVYALNVASAAVQVGQAQNVLVVASERFSGWLDYTDRSTCIILADGAGAAVVGPSDEPRIGPVVWGSDGEQYDLIRQREDWREVVAAGSPGMPHLVMQGNAVFRWAAYSMAKIAEETLSRTGITAEDLDLFVPHQANMRITDAMVRSMKLPDHVTVARDIAHQGNASAASIPLALRQMVLDGEARSGDLALLIAFGAGLSYAAQVIRVP
jgi:3-oxoacyl-[acyl-carrier-protein] synthase III